MSSDEKAERIEKALKLLRKRVTEQLDFDQLHKVRGLSELIAKGSPRRASARIDEEIRRYLNDPQMRAASVMLRWHDDYQQEGVDQRLEAFAAAEFISYDSARRHGDKGLGKLAWLLSQDYRELHATPQMRLTANIRGNRLAVIIGVLHSKDDAAAPPEPQVELLDYLCFRSVRWTDIGDIEDDDEVVWQGRGTLVEIELEDPTDHTLAVLFDGVSEFRSRVEVRCDDRGVHAVVERVDSGILVGFRRTTEERPD